MKIIIKQPHKSHEPNEMKIDLDSEFESKDEVHVYAYRNLSSDRNVLYTHLYELLSHYMKKTVTSELILRNENGKPLLNLPNAVSFNVSHSQDSGVIAVSRLSAVGIDVQYPVISERRLEIAERIFGVEAAKKIERIPDFATEEREFFHYWTATEAFIKAAGGGVFKHALEIKLDLLEDPSGKTQVEIRSCPKEWGEPKDWEIEFLDLKGLGIYAAVCVMRG